jgi:hypothetical protein
MKLSSPSSCRRKPVSRKWLDWTPAFAGVTLLLCLLSGRAFALIGDVNLDNQVTKEDSDLIANYLVGNVQTLPSFENADANRDGVADIRDALTILQFVNGIRPNLPGAPPVVLGVSPIDTSTNVPVTVSINVFFSNSIASQSISSTTVQLIDVSSAQAVAATLVFSQQDLIVTLTPVNPLNSLGTYRVFVSSAISDRAGVHLQASFQSQFTAAAIGTLVFVSGDHQSAPINTPLPDALTVRAIDSAGQPVPKVPITFQVDMGDGKLYPSQIRKLDVPTDAGGQAAVQFLLGGQATRQTVNVTAAGFVSSGTFTALAQPAAAVRLGLTQGTNQNCAVGGAVGLPLMARAMDAGGNGVLGTTVTFHVTQGVGTFDGTSPTAVKITDYSGAAQTLFTCQSSGTLTVEADFIGMQGQAQRFTFKGMVPLSATTTIAGMVINHAIKPIQGINIYLVSDPAIKTITDADGSFQLQPVPPGLQTVKIDGMHSTAADGNLYADLAYEVMTVQGNANPLPMLAILPTLDAQSTLDVSNVQGGTLTLRANPLWKVVVNPGQAIFPDGTRSGKIWVTYVPTDKIPMPPADGKYSNFLVAIEPPNVRFNPPAQVTFPNLDNDPPGAVLDIVSFDHDVGRFIPIGKGKVSEDGKTIVSLPGSGLVHGGWHSAPPQVPRPRGCLAETICPLGHITAFGQSAAADINGNVILCDLPIGQLITPIITCPQQPEPDCPADRIRTAPADAVWANGFTLRFLTAADIRLNVNDPTRGGGHFKLICLGAGPIFGDLALMYTGNARFRCNFAKEFENPINIVTEGNSPPPTVVLRMDGHPALVTVIGNPPSVPSGGLNSIGTCYKTGP